MKIVIDSNRVIAALVKQGTTRQILFHKSFTFFAPEFILTEIKKYSDEIRKKANIKKEEFDELLSLIFRGIIIIPQQEYRTFTKGIKITDPNDIPYLACCMSIKADGIWTHDPHFLQQNKIKIFTNIDLINHWS